MNTKHKLKWSKPEEKNLLKAVKTLGQAEAIKAHAERTGRTVGAIQAKYYSLQNGTVVKTPKKRAVNVVNTQLLIISFPISEYTVKIEDGTIQVYQR
jgi:predicted transcriptional regulator